MAKLFCAITSTDLSAGNTKLNHVFLSPFLREDLMAYWGTRPENIILHHGAIHAAKENQRACFSLNMWRSPSPEVCLRGGGTGHESGNSNRRVGSFLMAVPPVAAALRESGFLRTLSCPTQPPLRCTPVAGSVS